ncbi:hypothetical protein Ga0102493_11264 [Erythrobacter litoralis]|uniref:Uncharacterized protein n=1 Tax=Erythrobacter litoralis TaxID=39960 RepID=A0A074MNC7_9SPHN|nr:hypothetical protein [Erythrobacter litoralis]AOL24407.1 hypothetical protein Ga0102493_11264 [Erythrobacter litoralis]KEO93353.1 hypothetical protein EH32_11575 [Erythrobacter litoralis]
MKRFERWSPSLARAGCAFAAAALLASGGVLKSQDTSPTGDTVVRADILDQLKTCQRIQDDTERLACFDAGVGSLVVASEAGDVRLVDREDVRRTRRQLFGFSVPDVGILKGDEKDSEATETLTTTITSVRYRPRRRAEFTTAEGARWEIFKVPTRLADIEPGDEVELKKASLGTFFIRINGQMGVKGKRIE